MGFVIIIVVMISVYYKFLVCVIGNISSNVQFGTLNNDMIFIIIPVEPMNSAPRQFKKTLREKNASKMGRM